MQKKSPIITALLLPILLISCDNKKAPQTSDTDPEKLVWSEEFNYTGLPDATKWNYDVGGHGWGNNELQFYTEKRQENARVENGNLVIEARKENWKGNDLGGFL